MGVIHDGYGRGIDENNPLNTRITTNEILPVEIQARLSQTIQTHTNASVAPSNASFGNYPTSWIDCDGFSEIGLTFSNSLAVTSTIQFVWSNDGTNQQGSSVQMVSIDQYKALESKVNARYLKIFVYNGHSAPVTVNAWAYLKA